MRRASSRRRCRCSRTRTIVGLEADAARCRELLDRSTAVATALSPYLGYAVTADVAKAAVASGRSIREIVLERGLHGRRAARRDPVARGDDQRRASRGSTNEPRCARLLAAMLRVRRGHDDRRAAGSRPRRLFPPEELGVLEGARPRRVAEARPDHGRAAHRRRLGRGRRRRRRRLVHGASGPARRAQRHGLRGRRPAGRCSTAIRRRVLREGFSNVLVRSGRDGAIRAPRRRARRRADRGRVPRGREPGDLLQHLGASLKPAGRIGIVGFTLEGGGPGPPLNQRVDAQKVIDEAAQAGLRLVSRETFLEFQYLLILREQAVRPLRGGRTSVPRSVTGTSTPPA